MSKTDRHRHRRSEAEAHDAMVNERTMSILKGVALVAVVVVIGGGLLWWITASAAAQRSAAWDAFFLAADRAAFEPTLAEDALSEVSQKFPNTLVAAWSEIRLGDDALDRGLAAIERRGWAEADALLRTAITHFEKAERFLVTPGPVRDRAKLGLATANESLGRKENLDRARALYRELDRPESLYGTTATERLAALDDPATLEFYDDLVARFRSGERDETPEESPGVEFDSSFDELMREGFPGHQTPSGPGPVFPEPETDSPQPSFPGLESTPAPETPDDTEAAETPESAPNPGAEPVAEEPGTDQPAAEEPPADADNDE